MKISRYRKGTTLVEVTIVSVMIFTMSAALALSLSTVIDSYTSSQTSGTIEQDSRVIISRLKYSAKSHREGEKIRQIFNDNLHDSDGILTNSVVEAVPNAHMKLDEGALSGSFLSAPIEFEEPIQLKKLLLIDNISTTSAKVKVQVAVYDKTDGVCGDFESALAGPDGEVNSFYEETPLQIFMGQSGQYKNPGECVGYMIYIDRDMAQTESPKVFEIKLE
jgi:hypothetical protein